MSIPVRPASTNPSPPGVRGIIANVLATTNAMSTRAGSALAPIAYTLVSSAFVPINTLPTALQYFAAWNPVSVVINAIRELFGNPTVPTTVHSWPLDHAVLAAFGYCVVLLAIAVPASLRRYRARTSD